MPKTDSQRLLRSASKFELQVLSQRHGQLRKPPVSVTKEQLQVSSFGTLSGHVAPTVGGWRVKEWSPSAPSECGSTTLVRGSHVALPASQRIPGLGLAKTTPRARGSAFAVERHLVIKTARARALLPSSFSFSFEWSRKWIHTQTYAGARFCDGIYSPSFIIIINNNSRETTITTNSSM